MTGTFQVSLVIKNLPDNAGDIRNVGSIPGSRRSREGGHGNPLQYSCLENPMDRGTWQATLHRVTKSQIQLSNLAAAAAYTYTHTRINQCKCYPGST